MFGAIVNVKYQNIVLNREMLQHVENNRLIVLKIQKIYCILFGRILFHFE